MTENHIKKIIVVLSAGRSGTSLLMQILGKLGMDLSGNLLPGRLENPEGYFEDADIVDVHNKLLLDIGTMPTLPLPEGWLHTDSAREARKKLNIIVKDRLAETNTIWGFKDPRICSFLPLWHKIFNPENIIPKYILAVRNPASIASSLRRYINREEIITELQWLERNCEALQNSAADCFIVHYKDWFTRGDEVATQLLEYTGLDVFFQGESVAKALQGMIKENLNRSIYEDYKIQNEYVLKLYDTLKQCRGSDFDRVALMQTVKECRKGMNGFRGWYRHTQEILGSEKKHSKLEMELEKMVIENNRLVLERKELFDETENYRKQLTALSQNYQNIRPKPADNKQAKSDATNAVLSQDQLQKNWRREAIELKYSYSFRLGKIFIDAFTKPGKNTFLMPYYLLKLVWNMFSGRGKDKVRKALEGKV